MNTPEVLARAKALTGGVCERWEEAPRRNPKYDPRRCLRCAHIEAEHVLKQYVALVVRLSEERQREITESDAIFHAAMRAFDGEAVSDFEASFPLVRKAIDVYERGKNFDKAIEQIARLSEEQEQLRMAWKVEHRMWETSESALTEARARLAHLQKEKDKQR